jgi:signal transduction histidine kinase
MSSYKPQLAQIEVYELIDKLASTTTDLVTIHDVESDRIVYHNNSDIWKGMLNVDVYELPGEERVEAIVHPDHQETAKQFLQERKSLADDQVQETELQLINGHWVCVRSKIFQRDRDGLATQIISFTSDITNVKKAEREPAGRGTEADPSWINEANEHGAGIETSATVIDIDELKRSSAALQQLNARLQVLSKAKANFVNHVSPELLTPLTGLMGSVAEIIKGGSSGIPADGLQKLQQVYRGAVRLQKMFSKVLDFAKVEEDKLEAVYEPADFSKVTTDLAASFRPVVEMAGLRYVVKSEIVPAPVYLNVGMWEKIVFNLLLNALKFTHKGKIEVIIREKKKHVQLRVRDTGIGIAVANQERIFEWFTRIEEAPGRAKEGTGTGLALTRELLGAHGGTLSVRSEEGVGSEFIVSIPKGKSHLPVGQISEPEKQPLVSPASNSFVDEAMGWIPA